MPAPDPPDRRDGIGAPTSLLRTAAAAGGAGAGGAEAGGACGAAGGGAGAAWAGLEIGGGPGGGAGDAGIGGGAAGIGGGGMLIGTGGPHAGRVPDDNGASCAMGRRGLVSAVGLAAGGTGVRSVTVPDVGPGGGVVSDSARICCVPSLSAGSDR